MIYLIKFDHNGRRSETFVKEEKTLEQVQELLNDGFLEISETEYQLLIGQFLKELMDGHVIIPPGLRSSGEPELIFPAVRFT